MFERHHWYTRAKILGSGWGFSQYDQILGPSSDVCAFYKSGFWPLQVISMSVRWAFPTWDEPHHVLWRISATNHGTKCAHVVVQRKRPPANHALWKPKQEEPTTTTHSVCQVIPVNRTSNQNLIFILNILRTHHKNQQQPPYLQSKSFWWWAQIQITGSISSPDHGVQGLKYLRRIILTLTKPSRVPKYLLQHQWCLGALIYPGYLPQPGRWSAHQHIICKCSR